MPIYEYRCTSCGNLFEYFQKITDSPKHECEKCGGQLKRLISGGIGPIFKGTGFYQTDYKNSSNESSKYSKKEKSDVKKEAKTESSNNKKDGQS